jgi:hypothetical protein
VVELVALAALLALAGAVYARSLDTATNYDEGVYLASLDALRHGQALGSDVVASQPPGFYVLLQAIGSLADGVETTRVAFLLLALLGLGAAFAVGRKLAGVWGGFGAAGLLAITAPYPVQAARVQADTASVALALCSVAVLVHARRRPWPTAGAGALAAAAVSVKLLALTVAAPIAVLLVARRSWQAAGALAAGAAVVWALLVGVYWGALPDLWRTVVTEHRHARDLGPSFADNVHRVLLHPLDRKTPAALLVVIGLVCAGVFLRRVETLALATWIAATAAFLIYQRPLLDHHFVLVATVLAVPAGSGLGAAVRRLPHPAQLAVAGALAVALAAGFAQEGRRLAREPDGEPAAVRRTVELVRTHTSPDELVAADLPIVPYLAGRRVPGPLIDSSFVRLGSGALSDAEILDELRRERIRAVVVGRLYAERPALVRELRARYPNRRQADGITLYLSP